VLDNSLSRPFLTQCHSGLLLRLGRRRRGRVTAASLHAARVSMQRLARRAAFPGWRQISVPVRARVMFKLQELIRRDMVSSSAVSNT